MKSYESKIKKENGRLHRRAYPYIGNNLLTVTHVEYSSPKIERKLNGFKIVHISDLHNHRFGNEQSKLISAVQQERPDIIVVTGDSIDRRRTDIEAAMEFFRQAVRLSPVFFVTGNHEAMSICYKKFSSLLIDTGVIILDSRDVVLGHNNTNIRFIGLPDAAFFGYGTKENYKKSQKSIKETLQHLIAHEHGHFTILLSHRPELFDLYSECGAELVFCGHAHGGQVRLPLIGGLYSPGQGVFPRYTSGIYHNDKTALVVSRGLGNSIFPLRIFNTPEIVSLTLKSGPEPETLQDI